MSILLTLAGFVLIGGSDAPRKRRWVSRALEIAGALVLVAAVASCAAGA